MISSSLNSHGGSSSSSSSSSSNNNNNNNNNINCPHSNAFQYFGNVVRNKTTARYGDRVLESTRSGIRSTKSPTPAVVVYTLQLLVPPYRLTTIGRRSFPVAASIAWNSLPVHLQSSPSLFTFQQRLKTYLFQQSFPDIVI